MTTNAEFRIADSVPAPVAAQEDNIFPQPRIRPAATVIRENLTEVGQLLDLPPEPEKKDPKPEAPVDPNVREVQEQLQRALGLKVHIEDHNGRGKVIIEYAKLEDFDTLLMQLAGE